MLKQNITFTIKNKDFIDEFNKNFQEFLNNFNYDSNKFNITLDNTNVDDLKAFDIDSNTFKKDMFLEMLKNQNVKEIKLNIKINSHSYSSK